MDKEIIDKYIAGIDPYQPLADMVTCSVNIFKYKEVGRKLKKSRYFWVNWYRYLFNKQKWDIDYTIEYISPYKRE